VRARVAPRWTRTAEAAVPTSFVPLSSIRFQAAGFADYVFHFRQVVMFLRWGKRDRGVQSGDADDGAVEIVECFLINDDCDFSRQAAGAGVLVQDDNFVGRLDGLRDGLPVQRRDGTQVEDFQIDSLFT